MCSSAGCASVLAAVLDELLHAQRDQRVDELVVPSTPPAEVSRSRPFCCPPAVPRVGQGCLYALTDDNRHP